MLLLKDNKHRFLSYLFITGVGDGLFFLGVGKLLTARTEFVLGASLLFMINEISKLSFQFLASTLETKFSMKKAVVFSEFFQCTFLLGIVIFSLDIFAWYTLLGCLLVLNFFDGLCKIAEFNLTMSIFEPHERRRYNSLITTVNQTSRIIGIVLGGIIVNYGKYDMLFIFNGLSFLFSGAIATKFAVADKNIIVNSSWRSLLSNDNYGVLIYTLIIASNTVILASNSILGFSLSINSVKETAFYQIANAMGSTIAALMLYSKIITLSENKAVISGLLLQGGLFMTFNYFNSYGKMVVFLIISTISFMNLAIYITKLQDYAEEKFGSNIYALRQLNRAIFNLVGVSVLTFISIKIHADYQNVASWFCFGVCVLNVLLIKKKVLTYRPNIR